MALFEQEACASCPLRNCKKIKHVQGTNNLLVILDGNSFMTDVRLHPDYRFIVDALKQQGIKTKETHFMTSVICSRRKSKAKKNELVDICSEKVRDYAKRNKIDTILACGRDPIRSLVKSSGFNLSGSRMSTGTFWRGFSYPDKDLKAWVVMVDDISYIQENDLAEKFFMADLERVKELMTEWYYPPYNCLQTDERELIRITSEERTKKIIRKLLRTPPELLSIDIEANGLKPFDKDKKVWYVSLAWDWDQCIAFKMTKAIWKLFKKLMESDIPKVAQNFKYEHSWFHSVLGIMTRKWEWDTMLASHILDNREGITGLKFQLFVRYGIAGYESDSKEYWRSQDPSRGENAVNSIHLAPPNEMLIYCGVDTLGTWRLCRDQMKEMTQDEMSAMMFTMEGMRALIDVNINGIHFDKEQAKVYLKEAEKHIKKAEKKLAKTKVGKKWKKVFGSRLNFFSTDQCGKVMYEHLGYPVTKTTDSDKPSTDNEVLQEVAQNDKWAGYLLTMRKWDKIRGTYLDGFIRECGEDGKIHPNFSLNTTVTFRSSCSAPNFQNVPIRNPEFSHVLRGCFKPSPGHRLIEVDYSGVEVTCAAWYHKDPEMIKYLTDPTTDMHRDMALQLFMIPKSEMDDKQILRKATKNAFVFPQFYGDYYIACAKNLRKWVLDTGVCTKSGVPIFEHLASKGIKSHKAFEEHVRSVEDWFWNEKFELYGKWKEKWYKKYLKNLEFASYLGFPYRGPMRRNGVNNYAIQGTAFHILLGSLVAINKWIKRRGYEDKIKLVGQIHDSIVADVHDDVYVEFVEKAHAIMTKASTRKHKFIITPLEVEFDITPVDGSWHEKKSYSVEEVLDGRVEE